MYIEEFSLENVRTFRNLTMDLCRDGEPARKIFIYGNCGTGKTTILQALALLLADHYTRDILATPTQMISKSAANAKIGIRIQQGRHDQGSSTSRHFQYGDILIPGRSFLPDGRETMAWLDRYAFQSGTRGWFTASYGVNRHVGTDSELIRGRYYDHATHFHRLFGTQEPMPEFENWLIGLEAKIQSGETQYIYIRDRAIATLNALLPDEDCFDGHDDLGKGGRSYLSIRGIATPFFELSTSYSAALALFGDLIVRLSSAYPDSPNPFYEEGVVLIDNMEVHLDSDWQASIAPVLFRQFPNLQFIITTASQYVIAGAGPDAMVRTLNHEPRLSQGGQDTTTDAADEDWRNMPIETTRGKITLDQEHHQALADLGSEWATLEKNPYLDDLVSLGLAERKSPKGQSFNVMACYRLTKLGNRVTDKRRN